MTADSRPQKGRQKRRDLPANPYPVPEHAHEDKEGYPWNTWRSLYSSVAAVIANAAKQSANGKRPVGKAPELAAPYARDWLNA